jgi:hypothetical protein
MLYVISALGSGQILVAANFFGFGLGDKQDCGSVSFIFRSVIRSFPFFLVVI